MSNIGITCRWVWGTSWPAMMRPTRGGPKAAIWAVPTALGHHHQVGGQFCGDVEPVVNLGPGNNQGGGRFEWG